MTEDLSGHGKPSLRNAKGRPRPQKLFNRMANNAASPCGLAMISYAFFLLACLIPPSIYSHYMTEPDLMFLDPATILFYTLCVASFMAGAWLMGWLLPSRFVERKFSTRISPMLFLMAPLIVGILATIGTLSLLLIYHPEIILLLLTEQGQQLKEIASFEVASSVNLAPLALTAIVWWAYWRSFDLRLQGWKRRWLKSVLVIAVLLLVVTSTLILSRDILVMSLCGLAISYVIRRSANTPNSFRFVLRTGAAIGVSFAVLFFVFAFLRGSDSLAEQVHELFGYTAASYNRLAAIVNGDLRFPFAGRGLYVSSFVTSNHTFNKIFLLDRYMNWPSASETWGSEFAAVSRAGLDEHLVWPGAFGCIFSDFGWFSVPFVLGYGILYGLVWNWIKRGRTLGVVLYPCIGFCALFWIGSNALLDSQRAVVTVAALVLAGYELIFVRKIPVRSRD